ncbi:hypothetical protein HHK36_006478 [Tetracentron sinense]|uniref:Uncharacterized protein n=1 Tax=Tetracentron sinense TaxID=13715 RepID=A0A834ZKY9_TETSI|nr:hypothetical protein HHK36_006478 [Tetracentron sinense]
MSITRWHSYFKEGHQFALYTGFTDQSRLTCRIHCSASNGGRGFGRQSSKKDKTGKVMAPSEEKGFVSQPRKSETKQFDTIPSQGPGLSTRMDGKSSNISLDLQFEERLEAVRRSALEQRKTEENKQSGAIDYDAPVESDRNEIGLGTKARLLQITSPTEETAMVKSKLTKEVEVTLQTRLQQYEATLNDSPKDPTALEGAAVTLAELGEYSRAASLLENLTKEKPSDLDAYRLLGEIKYELKDYEGSAAAYRSSASASTNINFEILRGLTNALLAAQKPDEAVQVLLASREQITGISNNRDIQADASSNLETEMEKIDPIQVELLLGKAYSDWGHVSDAVSVYDQLISTYPNDFRGYLAKGIILKQNGKNGDAERMFIQARFFAPEKAKTLVDRYSRK